MFETCVSEAGAYETIPAGLVNRHTLFIPSRHVQHSSGHNRHTPGRTSLHFGQSGWAAKHTGGRVSGKAVRVRRVSPVNACPEDRTSYG